MQRYLTFDPFASLIGKRKTHQTPPGTGGTVVAADFLKDQGYTVGRLLLVDAMKSAVNDAYIHQISDWADYTLTALAHQLKEWDAPSVSSKAALSVFPDDLVTTAGSIELPIPAEMANSTEKAYPSSWYLLSESILQKHEAALRVAARSQEQEQDPIDNLVSLFSAIFPTEAAWEAALDEFDDLDE